MNIYLKGTPFEYCLNVVNIYGKYLDIFLPGLRLRLAPFRSG